MQAGWADTSRIEGVPKVAAATRPTVIFAGRPSAQRAADTRGGGVLLVLKAAVWNDDRIVRDRTHSRYYDLRTDYLRSVRRFTEAVAQHQLYDAASAYSAL